MIRAKEGHEIRVGDEIRSSIGHRWPVHRVTKKYAMVEYNDVAEGKFPRVLDGWYFGPIPRPSIYSTIRYEVWTNA